jgi:NAD(P)-dependent dehydrogenase (short-subunit alcohol dehydrogenase family)
MFNMIIFEGLAAEMLTKGIRANAIAPGSVRTPLITAGFSQEGIKQFGADVSYT